MRFCASAFALQILPHDRFVDVFSIDGNTNPRNNSHRSAEMENLLPTDLLIDLVKIYSPSREERAAVECLVSWMQAHDFDARIDAAGNAVGLRGREDAPNTLILLGHIDTYPGDLPVHVQDGKLYGRGSVDAKGSLCTFAEATAAATIPADWRVMVVGAVEEEAATSKGARQIREMFEPQMCIIGEPSGTGRITLGYKGRVILEYTLTRPVAHSARPESSVGALGAALWCAVMAWADSQNDGVEGFFDQVMPNLNSINTDNDSRHDTLHMSMSFRLPPRLTPDEIVAAVRERIEPDGVLDARGPEMAYRAERNNELARGMMRAIRAGGGKPGFVLKTGTSDMNVVGAKWDCPIIAYGPGDSNLDHTLEEHLPLEDYERAIATLRNFIENL
jgi:LysW-gamma-L-lysine carboxypeptidase